MYCINLKKYEYISKKRFVYDTFNHTEKDAPKDEEPSKETAPAEEGAAAAAPKEEAGDAPAAEGDGEGEGEGAEGADQTSSDGPTTTSSGESAELEHERRASFLEDVIDENYPEVIAAVEAALAHAREQLFKLPVGQWLDVLEQEIQKAEAERRERLAGPEMCALCSSLLCLYSMPLLVLVFVLFLSHNCCTVYTIATSIQYVYEYTRIVGWLRAAVTVAGCWTTSRARPTSGPRTSSAPPSRSSCPTT